jgi:NADP-dependent 3-hydroxy acid dehydrogenase YdfG
MIAKELYKNGAKVYITGRRLEVLQKIAAENSGLIP